MGTDIDNHQGWQKAGREYSFMQNMAYRFRPKTRSEKEVARMNAKRSNRNFVLVGASAIIGVVSLIYANKFPTTMPFIQAGQVLGPKGVATAIGGTLAAIATPLTFKAAFIKLRDNVVAPFLERETQEEQNTHNLHVPNQPSLAPDIKSTQRQVEVSDNQPDARSKHNVSDDLLKNVKTMLERVKNSETGFESSVNNRDANVLSDEKINKVRNDFDVVKRRLEQVLRDFQDIGEKRIETYLNKVESFLNQDILKSLPQKNSEVSDQDGWRAIPKELIPTLKRALRENSSVPPESRLITPDDIAREKGRLNYINKKREVIRERFKSLVNQGVLSNHRKLVLNDKEMRAAFSTLEAKSNAYLNSDYYSARDKEEVTKNLMSSTDQFNSIIEANDNEIKAVKGALDRLIKNKRKFDDAYNEQAKLVDAIELVAELQATNSNPSPKRGDTNAQAEKPVNVGTIDKTPSAQDRIAFIREAQKNGTIPVIKADAVKAISSSDNAASLFSIAKEEQARKGSAISKGNRNGNLNGLSSVGFYGAAAYDIDLGGSDKPAVANDSYAVAPTPMSVLQA